MELKLSSFLKTTRPSFPRFNLIYPKITVHLHHHSFTDSDSDLDSLVSALISAISSSSSLSRTKSLHCQVIKSLNYNRGFIGEHLVSAYGKLGSTEDAFNLFDELPKRDLVSFNSLISGFSRRGDLSNCFNAYSKMKVDMLMKPNEVTVITLVSVCSEVGAIAVGKYIHGFSVKIGVMLLEVKIVNALINFYGKSGDLDSACRLFEETPKRSLVSWNSIIAVHVPMGLAKEGVKYFVMMRRDGVMCDQATLFALLEACEIIGLRRLGEAVHAHMIICGFDSNLAVWTALLNLYAKLGALSASRVVFDEINDPDGVAWTAMLAGYAVHGRGREAIETFEGMVREGVVPDHVTFTHLLSACSHSGLVNEGKYYFRIMSDVYGIVPRVDHYSCMVDLLGRFGLLYEAYNLINSMPLEPNSGVWGALIGACRIYGNIRLGKEVAEKLFYLDPSDSRNYIMLSNMYSAAGQWKDASMVRSLMKDMNLIRNPGCSFIEHENTIHRFVIGDHSHPEAERIYVKLELLVRKIREAGFESKTEFVLHDVDEEVKEATLNEHSEKLAMAFGLLVTNPSMPIVISKNLRICGDCHSFAKVVSLIEKRGIVIRDTKRFHHFDNGSCSCGDYW